MLFSTIHMIVIICCYCLLSVVLLGTKAVAEAGSTSGISSSVITPDYYPGAPETLWNIAGSGQSPPRPADSSTQPASSVAFDQPQGIFVTEEGNIYVADTDNLLIRYIDADTGLVSTIAGDTTAYVHNDVIPLATGINRPTSVWVGEAPVYRDTSYYFVDLNNNIIRVVTAAGIVKTIIGSGSCTTYNSATNNNLPALDTPLCGPVYVVGDTAGNLYFSTIGYSQPNKLVRRLNAATNIVSVVAGTGNVDYNGEGPPLTTTLNEPTALWLDSVGNLYINDRYHYLIRYVNFTANMMTNVAGVPKEPTPFSGDNVPATTAHLYQPNGIWGDNQGNLYITNTRDYRIQRVNISTGIITTAVGSGYFGYSNDVPPLEGKLGAPWAVFVRDGLIYYTCDSTNRVQVVYPQLDFPTSQPSSTPSSSPTSSPSSYPTYQHGHVEEIQLTSEVKNDIYQASYTFNQLGFQGDSSDFFLSVLIEDTGFDEAFGLWVNVIVNGITFETGCSPAGVCDTNWMQCITNRNVSSALKSITGGTLVVELKSSTLWSVNCPLKPSGFIAQMILSKGEPVNINDYLNNQEYSNADFNNAQTPILISVVVGLAMGLYGSVFVNYRNKVRVKKIRHVSLFSVCLNMMMFGWSFISQMLLIYICWNNAETHQAGTSLIILRVLSIALSFWLVYHTMKRSKLAKVDQKKGTGGHQESGEGPVSPTLMLSLPPKASNSATDATPDSKMKAFNIADARNTFPSVDSISNSFADTTIEASPPPEATTNSNVTLSQEGVTFYLSYSNIFHYKRLYGIFLALCLFHITWIRYLPWYKSASTDILDGFPSFGIYIKSQAIAILTSFGILVIQSLLYYVRSVVYHDLDSAFDKATLLFGLISNSFMLATYIIEVMTVFGLVYKEFRKESESHEHLRLSEFMVNNLSQHQVDALQAALPQHADVENPVLQLSQAKFSSRNGEDSSDEDDK